MASLFASSEPRMPSAGVARRLPWRSSRIARAWARGDEAPTGGSSTRSPPMTAAASSALFRYRRRRLGTVGGSTAFAFAAAHPDEVRRIEHNTRHLSRPLGLPVMAVGGERSFGAAVAENLRHGASDVRQEVLPDCGHYVSDERPEELASLPLSFFDEI
jgi:pimeloyl-ACP methyl ester carboxylesterase